jgi:hypothetical protein
MKQTPSWPALGLAAALTACGAVTPPAPLPAQLAPPAGERLSHVLHADGVQIYECMPTKDYGHAWTLKAPEARLVDVATRRDMGRHYGGPSWEAPDGSRIVGQLKARADAPDAHAIPWLLIDARSVAADGSFAAVRSVQRVDTVGGKAPAGPCNAGATARVPYQAVYRFYRGASAERTVGVQHGPLAIAPEHVGLFPDEFHSTVAALAAVHHPKELSQ